MSREAGSVWPAAIGSAATGAAGSAAAALIILATRGWSRRLRAWCGIVVGVFVGVLFTYGVALVLGQWFGAFSFPVLWCWVAGGAVGMSAGAWWIGHRRGRLAAEARAGGRGGGKSPPGAMPVFWPRWFCFSSSPPRGVRSSTNRGQPNFP